MSDMDGILKESIRQACGSDGLLKFNALRVGSFEREGGSPDLEGIRTAVGNTFTPLESVAIMANIMKRLRDDGEPAWRQVPGCMDIASAIETHAERENGDDEAIAHCFRADPNHVRDVVLEARRIRMAMGKPIAANNIPIGVIEEIAIETKAIKTIADQALSNQQVDTHASASRPDGGDMATAEPEIDREIEQFAYGQTACSSIDIIDFIRYLKDKGYSFQEYIVLEKIYVKIEERKKEARYILENEVEKLFDCAQAPQEPDIGRLISRLKSTGLVFEEDDVRRMVRVARLRRTQ